MAKTYCWLLAFLLVSTFIAPTVHAGPQGGQVTAGSASINGGGALTTIQQNSQRAVIDWHSFSTKAGETVNFIQPNVYSAILNRVNGNLPSILDGSLNANGKVFLVNQNGIVVGANGVVNTSGGFIASTLDINTSAFMQGDSMTFSGNGNDVRILGKTTASSGNIFLIAPLIDVGASAEVTAANEVHMVAANKVRLSNGELTVIADANNDSHISIEGAVQAAKVRLEAHNNNLGALAINTSGVIRATGVETNADGSVSIVAVGGEVLLNDAEITARNADGKGGAIDVTGHQVTLENTTVDASGHHGGKIRIGGGYQGKESDIANAVRTSINDASILLANADAADGDGGKIVVWADEVTNFAGSLQATGRRHGGNAEVSGLRSLVFRPGNIDLSGGTDAGELLLDPNDIVISNAATSGISESNGLYDGGSAISNISISDLVNILATSNVTIRTSTGNGGNGDITIADPITLNLDTDRTLNLQADRDINVNAAINANISGILRLNLNAVRDITFNANIGDTLFAYFAAGRNIMVNSALTFDYGVEMEAGKYSLNNDQLGRIDFSANGGITFGNFAKLNSKMDATDRSRSDISFDLSGTNSNVLVYSGDADTLDSSLTLIGFNNVTWDDGGTGAVNMKEKIFVAANNIQLGASLQSISAQSLQLSSASYVSDNTDTNYESDGWAGLLGSKRYYGRIFFNNPDLTISIQRDLDLTSGIENDSTPAMPAGSGIRNDLPGTLTLNVNNTDGSVNLKGFNNINVDEDLVARNIHLLGNNITVGGNLTGINQLTLEAAALDYGNTLVKNKFAPEGWENLDGWLTFTGTPTLKSARFGLYSGVENEANRTGDDARVNLENVIIVPGDNGVTSLAIKGFRDVILPPGITEVSANYEVTASNIDARAALDPGGTGMATETMKASTLKLLAGGFADRDDISKPVLAGEFGGYGILTFPTGLMTESNYIEMTSGINDNNIHTDIDFASHVGYNGAISSSFQLGGFESVSLPPNNAANPQNVGLASTTVRVRSNNVYVRGDITSKILTLGESRFNGGTRDGVTTFNKDDGSPVLLRAIDGTSNWFNIANGETPADMRNVRFGYANLSDYTDTPSGADSNLSLEITGFRETDLRTIYATQTLDVKKLEVYSPNGQQGILRLYNDISATDTVELGRSGTRDYAIYGGDNIVKAERVDIYVGRDSAVNIESLVVNAANLGMGSHLFINEADNVEVGNLGASTNNGSVEINARGEITMLNDVYYQGDSLTLRGDAAIATTMDPDQPTFAIRDSNLIFASRDTAASNGRSAELGGDGYGSVAFSSAAPLLVTPEFRGIYVTETDLKPPAANKYFRPDGTAYTTSTTIPAGTIIHVASDANIFGLDTVTDNGVPVRYVGTVDAAGFTVPNNADWQFYRTDGSVYRPGEFIGSGTKVLYKPGANLTTQVLAGSLWDGSIWNFEFSEIVANLGRGSGRHVHALVDYNQPGSGYFSGLSTYTSLGLGTAASNDWSGDIDASITPNILSGDTPVDTSLEGFYYGSPVTGENDHLNMSGQFYVLAGNRQNVPTSQNGFANDGGKDSATGNSWDIGFTTASVEVNGDLRIFSASRHSVARNDFLAGDVADLNIYSNPPQGFFGYETSQARDGAVMISTTDTDGNLLILGYRDINVYPSGVLASNGNVTIGAARDLNVNNDLDFRGVDRLTTLFAGNMIKTSDNASIGLDGSIDLMLIAGRGVDVNTNVANIAGSLQDNPSPTDVLAGGIAANNAFNVNNTGRLATTTLSNDQVNNVQFTSSGIRYEDLSMQQLVRSGISASDAREINIRTSDLITLGGESAAPADISSQGDVFITAANIVQAVNTNGVIAADKLILSSDTDIGESASRVRTDVNVLAVNEQSVSNVLYIEELNSVEVSTNQVGLVDLLTLDGAITINKIDPVNSVTGNGSYSADDRYGMVALSDIRLSAGGTGGDVIFAAETATLNSDININAARNILDQQPGDLANGTNANVAGLVNINAAGNIEMTAGNSIGGDGVNAPDAIDIVVGGSMLFTSNGVDQASGTYLALLDNLASGFNLPATSLQVDSAKNIDITSHSSADNTSGNLLVEGLTSRNNGYIRAAASRNLTVNGAVSADGSGNVILSAGLGGTGTLTLNNTAGSTTGEINLRAADDLFINDTVSTGGQFILAESFSGDIVGGTNNLIETATNGNIALTAGSGSVGDSAQHINTRTGRLALNTAGDQFIDEADDVVFSSRSDNGDIDVRSINGILNIDAFTAITTTVTDQTGGVTTLASNSVAGNGVITNGRIMLSAQGSQGDVLIRQRVQSDTDNIIISAQRDVQQAADITTFGNAYISSGRHISSTAGVTRADALALNAVGSIGAADARMQTAVNRLGINSGGDQFITEADNVIVSASSNSGGRIDVLASAGTLTVDRIDIAPAANGINGYNGEGISTNSNGDVVLGADDNVFINADVTSEDGNIMAMTSSDFIFNTGQLRTNADASVSAGGGIRNISGLPGATQQQIVARAAELSATQGIGTGIIDNTLSNVNNPEDINMDVTRVAVANSDGAVVLWNRAGIILDDIATNGYFGINAGGAITEAADATFVVAGDAEFDTMRDLTIGRVDLATTSDLKTGGVSHVGGHFTASSEAGDVNVNGELNVNGDVTLNGRSIVIDGDIRQAGNVIRNGVISNHDGATIAKLVVAGDVATVTAYGDSADFNLKTLLSPAVLANLDAAGVTSVVIDLGNRYATYSITGSDQTAVAVANSGNNRIDGEITVRTGTADAIEPTIYTRNYHLIDGEGDRVGVDFGNKNVTVNAARGLAYSAGTTASTVAAVASNENAAAGFDAMQGSNVFFNASRSRGVWQVLDAYNLKIKSPSHLTVTQAHANYDALLLAGVNNDIDLQIQGRVFAGRHLLAAAGMDMTLTTNADISAGDRITFIVDEAAGLEAGPGWFRNQGASISSDSNNIAIYAVAGGTMPTGYDFVDGQIVLGNVAGLVTTQPISHWNTSFQQGASINTSSENYDGIYYPGAGRFGSPTLWYKTLPRSEAASMPSDLPSGYHGSNEIAGQANDVVLWPVVFGVEISDEQSDVGTCDTAGAQSCNSWSQRKPGTLSVLNIMKPTYLNLRHSKTDNQDALGNVEGQADAENEDEQLQEE